MIVPTHKHAQAAVLRRVVALMQRMRDDLPGMAPKKPLHDEIATFVRAVRGGSLAGTGRELGVPKSTVSRRVSRLEQQLAVKLLHRDGRQMVLTAEGKQLFDRVAGSVDAIDLAMQASQESMAMPRGAIRLTAPADFGRLLLAKELVGFGRLYPEIRVDLSLTDRFVDVIQEGFDLAIRAGVGPETSAAQNLISRKLMPSALKLAGTAAMAKQVKCLDDLKAMPFVLFRTTHREQTLRLRSKKGRTFDVPVSGRYVVHDYAAMAALVAEGAGLGLLPQMHIANSPSALTAILPDVAMFTGDVLLVYPTRQFPRRVSLLIDHLTRAFTSE